MSIPHPIPYQGSKRNLAPLILGYFPEGASRLIEPFAGSAAVSLYAAQSRKISQFILNDINAPLMSLWDTIIHQPDDLANRYQSLWRAQQGREREFYDQVRAQFNQSHCAPDFLYLLARCVKASVRYNAAGEFNQSPDNRRKGRQPEAMRRDICGASSLLKDRVSLLTGDYRAALELAAPSDLVYLDPPYQGVCANHDPRYLEGVVFDQFVKALQRLNDGNISYIVSYDGRTGQKNHGRLLPKTLSLRHIEVDAGRSSQATLLGRDTRTYESLYLSPALVSRNAVGSPVVVNSEPRQLLLFGELA